MSTEAQEPSGRATLRSPGRLYRIGSLIAREPARRLASEAAWLVAAATLALVLFGVAIHLWDAHLHVPLYGDSGDQALNIALVKDIVEHGWYWSNPDLGAPFGLQLYDFTVSFGDLLHYTIIKGLSFGSSDPVAIVNVFYVLSYPLIAATSFGVMRALGFSRPVSLVIGVVYALAPYHLMRGPAHLALAAYYAVPIGCWLVLAAMGGRTLFARRERAGPRALAWASATTLRTLGLCLVVGIATVYYAVFTAVLVVLGVGVVVLATRDRRQLLTGIAVAGAILVSAVACQVPTLVYHAKHGRDAAVANRQPLESEVYGLTLARMVFPREGHRVKPLSNLGHKYAVQTPLPSESWMPNLGITASLGLLLALLAAAAALAGRQPVTERGRLARDSGLVAALAFGVGTAGGGSALIAYTFTAQVRGWNRISIFVAFFALIAVAGMLEWAGDGLRRRRPGRGMRFAIGGGLAALTILAALDQTTPGDVPRYGAAQASWENDARFVSKIEALMPQGAMIYQLPYVPFPENPPVVNMVDGDEFKGYLHSHDLRWSYAQLKGLPEDWAASAQGYPLPHLVPALVASGFDGIYLDTAGYQDAGADVTGQLNRIVGPAKEIVSDDRRLAFFPLIDYTALVDRKAPASHRAAAAQALLHPAQMEFGDGFYSAESSGASSWRWAKSRATLTLDNRASSTRTVRLTFGVRTGGSQPASVRIAMPGNVMTVFASQTDGPSIDRRLSLPPGKTKIELSTDSGAAPNGPGDTRDLHLQLLGATVGELAPGQLERDVNGRAR